MRLPLPDKCIEMAKRHSRTFVDEITADLQEAYLGDRRPWIVGFSGEKDSSILAASLSLVPV